MEVKLENLIEKIKKDGVEEAKKASEEIIQKAHQEAKSIVDRARLKAAKMEDEARQAAQKLKNNTENSLRQAARDLVLSLKNELTALFDQILKRRISQELNPDLIKQLIIKLINKWSEKKDAGLEVLVSKEDKKKVEELLLLELKNQAREKIQIRVSKTIEKGFHISLKGEDFYYDFTEQSILEALKEFLNPAISIILDSGNG